MGFIGLLTWQALRGQPVLAPDTVTLAAYAALIGITGVLAAAVIAHSRRSRRNLHSA